jgi:hypothetical protein
MAVRVCDLAAVDSYVGYRTVGVVYFRPADGYAHGRISSGRDGMGFSEFLRSSCSATGPPPKAPTDSKKHAENTTFGLSSPLQPLDIVARGEGSSYPRPRKVSTVF